MKTIVVMWAVVVLVLAVPATAEVTLDGFVQGLFGGRLDGQNPTASELTASETRLQLRAEHFGEDAEFFGRLDFLWDGADTVGYDWELREAYLKFRLGDNLDFKVGRQVLTWGTGDLIFINDVFAKDYRSFFVGRDEQYLKAPQNALRIEHFSNLGSLSLVLTPRFEANRLPTGRRLSYFNPMADSGRGAIVGEGFFFDPPIPEAQIDNAEVAVRFQRQISNFATALYFYRGFYKNPVGVDPQSMTAFYPELNVYGLSLRGSVANGIIWLEGGFFDSRQDRLGINPFIANSSTSGLIGFERQVGTDLTANLQWQVTVMKDYKDYLATLPVGSNSFNEVRHLLTSRWTKLLNSELVRLSAFMFYSPTDKDYYLRLATSYKYSDEVKLTLGGNFFGGDLDYTEFGQFKQNDNIYAKFTYGF